MKLIIAVVNNDDSAIVTSALTKAGHFVTKLSTSGGFLMVGNSTLLIGVNDDKIDDVMKVISEYCSTRTQVNPSTLSFGREVNDNSLGTPVTVGGATVFVLSIDRFEKL
ncbi:MAG: cyclic-di-AMP receptor [Saccharofermentanales bacterium]